MENLASDSYPHKIMKADLTIYSHYVTHTFSLGIVRRINGKILISQLCKQICFQSPQGSTRNNMFLTKFGSSQVNNSCGTSKSFLKNTKIQKIHSFWPPKY